MVKERNLLDYAYVLVKWRRMILVSVFLVSLAAAGISLLLPEKWTAATTLLPPQEDVDSFAPSLLSAAGSAIPVNLGRLIGTSAPGERLLTFLGSRRVLGKIVDRFSLMEEYGVPKRDQAIGILDEKVTRELGRDGTLTIEVESSDPERAAEIANALARELDRVNQEVKRNQAGFLRRFLEERMDVVQKEIEKSSLAMQHFQEKYGLVDIDAQTAAAVEVIRNVVQELTMLEVELGVSRRRLAPDHELRRQQEMEVEELQQQLRRLSGELEQKKEEQIDLAVRALGPPLKDLPGLAREYARLALDLKIKEQILLFLGTRLEEAKYKEAMNTPTIQVLDPATPPQIRSAPRRTLIVLAAACTSLVVSVVLAFVFESAARLKIENAERFEAIVRLLRPRA